MKSNLRRLLYTMDIARSNIHHFQLAGMCCMRGFAVTQLLCLPSFASNTTEHPKTPMGNTHERDGPGKDKMAVSSNTGHLTLKWHPIPTVYCIVSGCSDKGRDPKDPPKEPTLKPMIPKRVFYGEGGSDDI